MSNSLVRKSLDLLTYEIDINKDKKKKKKEKTSGTLDLIPICQRLISKKKTGSSLVLKRSGKLTVYEAKKQIESKIDPTDKNVQKLLLLSTNKLDSQTTDKLLCRAVNKHYITQEKKPVEETATVFTEEDFKKFEAEYIDQ